jgi:thymidylate kinase
MTIVTFSGVDGAGKSTQVKLFTDYLNKEKIPYKKIHIIKNSFAAKLGFKKPAVSSSGRHKKSSCCGPCDSSHTCPISLFLRKLNLLIDLSLFKLSVFWNQKKPLVVIFDRYFFDYLVNIYYLEKEDDPRLSPLLKKLIPKPDLSFFFDLDPKEAQKRKQEQGIEYLVAKRNLFLKLKKSFGLTIIQAEKDPQAIAKKVQEKYQNLSSIKNV